MNSHRTLSGKASRLPLGLWLAAAGFLLISLSGWVRLYASLRDGYWLEHAGLVPGPLYLALTGGLWGLVGLVAGAGIWLRYSASAHLGWWAALFFVVSYWGDRLLFSHNSANVLFAVLVSLGGLIYVAITMRWWKRRIREDENPAVEKNSSS